MSFFPDRKIQNTSTGEKEANRPTEHFKTLEPQNLTIDEFCDVQKWRSEGFEALQLLKAPSGERSVVA